MGRLSPKDRGSKSSTQKRRSRSSRSKCMKPGAHLPYSKASGTRSCSDLVKKSVALLDNKKGDQNLLIADKALGRSPLMISPVSPLKQNNALQVDAAKALDDGVIEGTPTNRSPVFYSPINYSRQNNLLRTPKTPRFEDCDSESMLEALTMDLLVKILCHLHHDQLKAVFHVSRRIRKAVLIARQFYFNYTTPDHSRQEMLRMMTPKPTDRWPFRSRREEMGAQLRSPVAPKAPRQSPRPPSRTKLSEMRQIAAVLFQEKSTFRSRCNVPSVLSKPWCKPLASNRALFYEDDLCQAVSQNKLL